jgi:hypothetical protein
VYAWASPSFPLDCMLVEVVRVEEVGSSVGAVTACPIMTVPIWVRPVPCRWVWSVSRSGGSNDAGVGSRSLQVE